MPLYISVPTGYTFTTIDEKDVLVSEIEGEKIIPVQEYVKTYLQNRKSDSLVFCDETTHGESITLYFKRPPSTEARFLQYVPNRNGKLPTTTLPVMVRGVGVVRERGHVPAGSLWHLQPDAYMTLKTRRFAEITREAAERRLNRRKEGDCPKAN